MSNGNGAESHGMDFFYRFTDKNGNASVRETRVWDKESFIEARKAEARKEGGKAAFQQLTREQYLKAR